MDGIRRLGVVGMAAFAATRRRVRSRERARGDRGGAERRSYGGGNRRAI